MKEIILSILFLFFSMELRAQKSCNQIPYKAINIIINPSFENNTGPCPSGYVDERGLVVPSWYTPTNLIRTAYFNECTNFTISNNVIISESRTNSFAILYPVVPQPIPDGKGVIAVTDIAYTGGLNTYPFRKSYASTCLTDVLQKDSVYKLEFYVGFGTRDTTILSGANGLIPSQFSPTPENFSLFGTSNCQDQTPPQPILGCPAVVGWTKLGSCTVSGAQGTWVKANIQFTSPQNIRVIAIGPSCDTMNVSPQDVLKYQGNILNTLGYSYFLDKLQFYLGTAARPVVSVVTGSLCNKVISLQMQPAGYFTSYSLQWFKNGASISGEHNSTISVSAGQYGEGWYQCSVENDSVCLMSDSLQVQWKTPPPSNALESVNNKACQGDTVLLNAFHDSLSNYIWQDGSTRSSLPVTKSGTYQVTVTNECATVQSQKTINFQKCNKDLFVPNAFSPNGDGINDIFRVSYFYPPPQYRISIFNRLGQKVFSSSDPSKGWDGTIRGLSQPPGAYVWIIIYKDDKNLTHTLKGTVLLVR